ncbi:Molybdopterin biosynthesis molybdochelatase MogA [Bathymodiolus thermophilus thioautotrophic gill symbiont]|jgi:molybdopterin adenylyltransferase|uniref:Molybdopterin adenylyltransferase n=1 Tax=Bathymodiolus thermophilus thioautotrophic gill symbiont TaxID=2360 RepID=A0A8H8XC70_9GAMM|nr:molybdopterin adenylyltransferase [Bathymodiolus thermophilus thioautotrophic gill symbiont]CAB5496441.1 Molybdopterin adenylyltransferase (EC [Bathymodiolus thermophilus thioautotrophic gill symbiont]SGZ91890.1 Molybdopterin biosynthesis molybdochelatase MogA [Bathymodiolus thermophilus thioautotrophic gill symbiont]
MKKTSNKQQTTIKVGFITISDRAARGEYEDIGGPAMQTWINNALLSPYEIATTIIEDEQTLIERTMIDFADNQNCNLILTTGGTGPTTRDVTPEATHAVCERIFDGFAEQMRAVSLRTVPTAILSRQTAGTRGKSLIINLPGKPEAIAVCLGAIFLAVPKCLELLDNSNIQIDLDFVEKNFG